MSGPWALGPIGPHGAPWGSMGPYGALWGPMGPNVANFPIFGKTFFQKKYPKIQNVNFGVKTKVVRTEILHILVPIPSRGDP